MAMRVKCFLIEPVGKLKRSLRRYSSGSDCPLGGYHDARVFFDEIADDAPDGLYSLSVVRDAVFGGPLEHDSRWPESCRCGFRFTEDDERQIFLERIYVRADTGEEITLDSAPPGAMWYADWILVEGSNLRRGPDGRSLAVRLPNGNEWMIDARASNCTMPEDKEHRCWVRHGTPPIITVDKNGHTCSAGGGSIQSGDYHGFLRNGEFTE